MNSQSKNILDHLQRGNAITPIEALNLYGCFRLGARIWDLKKQGYYITTDLVNINDKVFASYKLQKEIKQLELF